MLETSNLLAFIGADEYYIKSSEDLIAGSQYNLYHKNAYIWADDVYENERTLREWNIAYEKIMYANLALDIEKTDPIEEEKDDFNRTRIAALFHRAWNYYQLSQLFCKVYAPENAEYELGLPLRLDYDVSVKYGRSTVKEVYSQILADLQEAEKIPLTDDRNIYLPGKLAVQALLARVYLQMGNYEVSEEYASKVLDEVNTLVDYNDLDFSSVTEFSNSFNFFGADNPAIIFYSHKVADGILLETLANADTTFVRSMAEDDLRKQAYFFHREDGSDLYSGSYAGYGGIYFFTGLSVEETLLTRAECRARLHREEEALSDLHHLQKRRYTGERQVVDDDHILLERILEERQKELFMRGIRWEDVRRLNREGTTQQVFRRILDGVEYNLSLGSEKWVWPIPSDEVDSNKIQQNER